MPAGARARHQGLPSMRAPAAQAAGACSSELATAWPQHTATDDATDQSASARSAPSSSAPAWVPLLRMATATLSGFSGPAAEWSRVGGGLSGASVHWQEAQAGGQYAAPWLCAGIRAGESASAAGHLCNAPRSGRDCWNGSTAHATARATSSRKRGSVADVTPGMVAPTSLTTTCRESRRDGTTCSTTRTGRPMRGGHSVVAPPSIVRCRCTLRPRRAAHILDIVTCLAGVQAFDDFGCERRFLNLWAAHPTLRAPQALFNESTRYSKCREA